MDRWTLLRVYKRVKALTEPTMSLRGPSLWKDSWADNSLQITVVGCHCLVIDWWIDWFVCLFFHSFFDVLSLRWLICFFIISSAYIYLFFADPIMCYTCRGTAVNSTCADPIDARTNPDLVKRECMNGVCLKWTKYIQGKCTAERMDPISGNISELTEC